MSQIKKLFTDGIFDKNPILVQLLGTCATLAVTTSITNGLAMGLSTTAVLVCSNLFISLLRNFIPKEVRIASYIVVISGFVTAIELLIKAYLPEINKSLGVFIPLIVVNCIILSRAESFASKNKPVLAMLDGVAMGAGFTIALVIVSAIRELLGNGTLFGKAVMPDGFEPSLMFVMSAGAFFTLAFVVAGMNKIMSMLKKRAEKKEVE
ncbi:MAG: electron transport complex subunit E [Ruminococcaceae bacterium]|nr:electron transport complex subunit E [Oscillospiraceae bacterium]